MKRAVFLLLFCCYAALICGQEDSIRLEDYVYVTNIKSVTLSPAGSMLEPPVTYVGGASLVLTYDDLDADQKDYTYDIIHCDRNWNRSTLQKYEYIDGFVNEEVDSWKFSNGTFVPYTHYALTIPNQDVTLTASGNYVIVVYDGQVGDDRIPVFTRRFVVVEDKIGIKIKERRPLSVSKYNTHQEFDLSLDIEDIQLFNPMKNIAVTVTQDGNWHRSIDLSPKLIAGNTLVVDNVDKISFSGLKEFRSLDIRSFEAISNDINTVQLKDEGTDILVKLGYPRVYGSYNAYPDVDGAFVLTTKDRSDGDIQGDYGNVIFSLQSSKLDEDVYVIGRFSDWQIDDTYKMIYDETRGIYLAKVLLKQGWYDYMFATNKEGQLDISSIEGDSYKTTNYYQVFVYQREPGDRYDRVVGYKKIRLPQLR